VANDYTFKVQVTDSSGDPQTSEKVITVSIKDPLSITTKDLKEATVGRPYETTLAANGGNPKYRFELAGGALPDGLHLSEEGKLFGTPTKEGIPPFVVKVTDSATPPKSASVALFISVTKAGF
jgi:hypothetical protein